MIFRDATKAIEKFTSDHATLILTGIGVAGTISTAVLTGKATIKAIDHIEEKHQLSMDSFHKLDKKTILADSWKFYIPAVTTGSVTVGCIIAANRIGTSRAAAMAAAYTMSDKAFVEYKEKVKEHIGIGKEQKIKDDVAQQQVTNNPPSTTMVIQGIEQIVYDPMSGRYFASTMEEVKRAMNEVNYRINADGYATLSEFYDAVGLPQTELSHEVGWNRDKLMEITFSTVLTPESKPALSIDYRVLPIRDFHRH